MGRLPYVFIRFLRWTCCAPTYTEVDRGPDGRRLPFTLTQPFRFTVPPVLWFLVLTASFPWGFINFLTKALSIYVPLVSRTVLLDLALPDTWDYKAPSTAPDFFPQLCNGEGRNFFCEKFPATSTGFEPAIHGSLHETIGTNPPLIQLRHEASVHYTTTILLLLQYWCVLFVSLRSII